MFNDGWRFVPATVPADRAGDAAGFGEPVTLPHTWNALDGQDGGNDYRRGAYSYLKQFSLPPGDEVWLEFCGANSSTDVYLNGRHLARHDGGYSTFRVDLTPALATENTLLVVVDNAPNDRVYPQRADFTFYGGLYRDVRLIRVPATHFRLDDHGGPGLAVTSELEGDAALVTLRAEVTGGDAVRFVIEGVGWQTVDVDGEGVATATLTVDDVRRWHGLRDPHLYRATAELLVDGEPVDAVSLRFGCREFAVDPERGFLLNGESYPLRGVSRHQDWEGVGNAITPAMMETDLDLLLELGATTVRLAHYQHDQRFYDLCDEAGIVVWAEIPQITEHLPGAAENAVSQLTELVVQNRHHPSIVCWGLSNEITVAGNSEAILAAHRDLNDLAHQLDPTRLTTMAHVFLLEPDDPLVRVPDVMSYNLYFGWYAGELEDNDRWFADFRAAHPGVAVGLAEYGADANPRFQTADPVRGDYTEQFQARYHEHMLDLVEASPYLWATHVWTLADFAADGREEGGQLGRNQKGLVSFDRTVRKDAFYLYKAAWSDEPFVHLAGRRYVDRPEEVTEATVYSNQPQVSLYRDGDLVGTRTGRRVFRFDVRLDGEHELTARSGELTDTIRVRRVGQPNPEYAMPVAAVVNWFDEVELPCPPGFYSINDTLGDIKQSPQGAVMLEHLMAQAVAKRGDVAQNVQIPEAMQLMLDRQTLIGLLRQMGGGIGSEQITALNAALNQIPKLERTSR